MRRTLVMLAVTALLVLALAVPAFAFTTGEQPPGPPDVSGAQGEGAQGDAGAAAVHCNSEELGGQGTVVTVEQNNSAHGGGDCTLPV